MKSKIIFGLVLSIISTYKSYSMKRPREASLQEHEVQQKHSTCKRHKRQHSPREALRCKIFSLPIELRALTLEQLLRDYLKSRDFNTLKHVVQAFHADEVSRRSYYYLLKNKDILVHILQDINSINSRTENPISKLAFLNILMNNNLDQLQDWKVDYLGTNVFPELQRWYKATQITKNRKPPFNVVLEAYKRNAISGCKSYLMKALTDERIRRRYTKQYIADQLKRYIKIGAAVNCINDDGRLTPLIAASVNNDELFVDILLSAGANVNQITNDNEDPTPLLAAADHEMGSIAQKLIQAGADIEAKDSHGMTPLLKAVAGGNIETVSSLLDAGANINVQDTWLNNTPLIEALTSGHEIIAALLLREKADSINLSSRNRNGDTALDIAENEDYKVIADQIREIQQN